MTTHATLEVILKQASAYYHETISRLQGKRRLKNLVQARQVFSYLARKHTKASFQTIGHYLGGRDHTTIMHGVRQVEKQLKKSAEFRAQMDELENKVAMHTGDIFSGGGDAENARTA